MSRNLFYYRHPIGKACEKCGYNDPRALHLHHVRDKKGKVIGEMTLCANCHYIIHSYTTSRKSNDDVQGVPSEFKQIEDEAIGHWFIWSEVDERYRELLFYLHNILSERYLKLNEKNENEKIYPPNDHIKSVFGRMDVDIAVTSSKEFTFKELDLLRELLRNCDAEFACVDRTIEERNKTVNTEA